MLLYLFEPLMSLPIHIIISIRNPFCILRLHIVRICILYYTLYSRHDKYWQTAYSNIFGRIKLHKKGYRNIFFLLKKVISIKGSILWYCVSNIWHKILKMFNTYNTVLQNYLLIEITFLSKKIYISRYLFMQFYATKNLG